MPNVRPATARDKEFLWDLHCRTMRTYVEATWGWDEADQRARFDAAFDPARTTILEQDGRAAGMLIIERSAAQLRLCSIEIAPEFQNRGLGSAIIAGLIDEAAGRPVWLQVLKANPAKALYDRLGFVVAGETPTHWQMMRGPD